MSGVAMTIEGLGKRYRLGGPTASYGSLRESMMRFAAAPWRGRRTARDSAGAPGAIWALKDLTLQLNHGEVLGVIGRNGAGKSTLLKIISRITKPTSGRARIYGRVGSLLEVGTGFHPELTGRENIFLNGAVLGMGRTEIRRRFEAMVAFAGVESFLDTPVKHYSSGMYMRLAFAVAAHLEPEILVVDEVLAVGDAAFQKKCLGKMGEVAREGRTVILVSHNMAAIRSLCHRCILLNEGQLYLDSSPDACIDTYLKGAAQDDQATVTTTTMTRPGNIRPDSGLRTTSVRLHTASGRAVITNGEDLTVTMEFTCTKTLRNLAWGFYVETLDGLRLVDLKAAASLGPTPILGPGTYSVTGSLPRSPLGAGRYTLGVGARNEYEGLDWLPTVLQFVVEDSTQYDSLWFEQSKAVLQIASVWQPPARLDPLELPSA